MIRFFKTLFYVFLILGVTACGYHKPKVNTLPATDAEAIRTLFIAMDGVSYDTIKELQAEGYYKTFRAPMPLIVTFPSATTTSFTGIYQPLDAGRAPGYEIRFFSKEKNKVVGGTPWEVYKIHIPYKYYFDEFRHTMTEKEVMYTFPGVAGRQDLKRAENLLLHSDKKVMMSYLGGTDGAQHMLGKNRIHRFLIYADQKIELMKRRYAKTGKPPVRIVMFSDHGFHFDRLKMISGGDVEKAIRPAGYQIKKHLQNKEDVVPVEFGLLSAGVLMTQDSEKSKVAHLVHDVEGFDLTFWEEGNKILMVNHAGEEAYFEYQTGAKAYRYVPTIGDPLHLNPLLMAAQIKPNSFLPDSRWFALTSRHYYPDPGHRLYAAFHTLVENEGSLIFSLLPRYQFGSSAALVGTYLKFGHKGTHGGLFWDVSAGVAITDDPTMPLPEALRYDQLFDLFLPEVTKAYREKLLFHDTHH